jgi:hypothetical protein
MEAAAAISYITKKIRKGFGATRPALPNIFFVWFEHLTSVRSVFLADEHLESAATPCDVRPHAADRIRLDHGVNARGFECSFGNVRLRLAPE